MNTYTKDISALLNITLERARLVQTQMEWNGVDFSECSKRTFAKEAKIALSEI